jgi:hypothetical protein
MHQNQPIAYRYLITGALAAPLGMLVGIGMAASHNHALAPVHAHLLLLGWVGFFLPGLYYRSSTSPAGKLAHWQFGLGLTGLLVMVPSLAAFLLGYRAIEPVLAGSSILILASYLLFALKVIRDGGR